MTVERVRAMPMLWFGDRFFNKWQAVEQEIGMVRMCQWDGRGR